MTREEKTDWLLQYLKAENTGYAAIPDPVNFTEKETTAKSDECADGPEKHPAIL